MACALVTGASSGIGAAFARALGREGRRLVLVARREDRLHALADGIGSPRVDVLPLDLARSDAVGRLEAELRARGLEVDLLVNNAGVGHGGRFLDAPLERSLGIIDLNVRSVVELTARLVPPMVARGRGGVINVVSMSAFQPVPYLAVYAASKAFLLSFTEALGLELAGTGVRVQALCPGNVPTEFQATAGTAGTLFDRTSRTTPDEVVADSLAALARGTERVIPGWQNRMVVAAQALAPRGLVRRVAGELFRPRATGPGDRQ